MNAEVLALARELLRDGDVRGKRVLEAGSYDINGSLREVVGPLEPDAYVGVDIRPGPGVDAVCAAGDLEDMFGPGSFDAVLCSSTLSHVEDWRRAVRSIKTVLRDGGFVFVVAASRWKRRVYRAMPYGDHWRFSAEALRDVFADFDFEAGGTLRLRKLAWLGYLKAWKITGAEPADLDGIELRTAAQDGAAFGSVTT